MAIGNKRPVVMEADRAVPSGIATLGSDGKLLDAQIPGLDKLGAAPAGYGLGEYAPILDAVDLDTVRKNGWYRLLSNCVNAPTTSDQVTSCSGALLEVIASTTSYVTEQKIYLGTAGQQGYMLRRFYNNATKAWQPWEWINPRLVSGKEYRTTERYDDKPVYVQIIPLTGAAQGTLAYVEKAVGATALVRWSAKLDEWGIPTSIYGGLSTAYDSSQVIHANVRKDGNGSILCYLAAPGRNLSDSTAYFTVYYTKSA